MSDQSEVSVGLESPGKSNSSSDFEKPFTRSSSKERKRKKSKSYDNICDANFQEDSPMEQNVRTFHEKTHKCKKCEYSTFRMSHLKDHNWSS